MNIPSGSNPFIRVTLNIMNSCNDCCDKEDQSDHTNVIQTVEPEKKEDEPKKCSCECTII